jgi:uncharacterized protein involved in cysteine biosynthesis
MRKYKRFIDWLATSLLMLTVTVASCFVGVAGLIASPLYGCLTGVCIYIAVEEFREARQ